MPLLAIPLALIVLAVFTGLGGCICRVLKVRFESIAQEFAFSAGLGMGLVSYGVLILGLCGKFSPCSIVTLIVIFGIIGGNAAWDLAHRMCICFVSHWRSLGAYGFFAAGALTVGVIGALGPEIGNDALCYHLNVPKIFLQQGFISVLKYDPNSHYPFLLQNLYGVGLALHAPALAKMFHWMTGLLAACAIFGATRRYSSRQGASAAAAIFLLTPGILNQLGIAYVDVGLACFSFLALCALTLYWEEKQWQLLVLAGCFMGFALSIKHLAMMSFAVLAVIGVARVIAGSPSLLPWRTTKPSGNFMETLWHFEKAWWNAGIFLSCMFVFSFFWYTRSYLIFGNPVHPFYGELFGVHFMPMSYHNYAVQGFGKGWQALLLLPWNMTMRPLAFEDFVSQIGPVFLAFGPAMVLLRPWPLRWKIFGAYAVFFTLLWFYLGQNMRFWFAALPPLAILTAAGVFASSARETASRRMFQVLLYAFLSLELTMGLYHHRASLKSFWSATRQSAYLKGSERTYDIAQWINQHLPGDAKILASDETHGYYIYPRMIRDNFYCRWTRYDEQCDTPEKVMAFFKKEGFTHILHAISQHSGKMREGQGPLRLEMLLSDAASREKYFRLLHRQAFSGTDGEKLEYFLYEMLNC